ncbi:glycosyltransferase family 4 protein [uncultured Cohaesibacter sp.]|uniref:glycosyltransferase family 4 protein n=1 Tax=uncultured Cohaesibacter sp. TaxID=1002546 RepID=UPI00292FE086|nr:glycosyltransferase family 4 protein [uncultured Cohaesibacter sp.]
MGTDTEKSFLAPIKVAMVVHNSVLSDARVRKQARSLKAKNIDVHLFGYGESFNSAKEIDGVPLTIVQKSSPVYIGTKFKNFYGHTIGVFIKKLKKTLYYSIYKNSKRLTFLSLFFLNLLILCYFIFKNNDISAIDIFWPANIILILFLLLKSYLKYFLKLIAKKLNDVQKKKPVPVAYRHISNKLADAIAPGNFNVIHSHDIIGLMTAVKLKKAAPDTIVIWDAHELYTEVSYKTPDVAKFMGDVIRKSSKFVDHFTTISSSFKDIYAKQYPRLPKASILMNATPKTVLEQKFDFLQQAANLKPDQKILLFQGGLAEGRGIRILLDAAPRLPRDWSVVFMGNGRLQGLVNERAEQHQADRPSDMACIVSVPSAPYDELAKWTSGATLGIIPYENTSLNHVYCTPNKLWEYPNAGVPILASDMVEMSKMINQFGIGLLLPRDFTEDDIVNAVTDVTDDQLDEMRNNCLAYGQSENWEKYEPSLLAIYEEIQKK